MNKTPLPPRGIVILDSRKSLRPVLARQVAGVAPSVSVKCFADSSKATSFFSPRELMKDRMEPAVVVTDGIGTRLRGGDFVDTVRKEFPLTMIMLYSGSTESNEAADLAFRDQTIDDYVSKNDAGLLFGRVSSLYNKYVNQCSLSRLRTYIERCPDPETPFLPNGKGDYLNIIDAYWEIVWQTELGRELLVAWDRIVDDWYQPEPFQGRKLDSYVRKRHLCNIA